MLSVGESFLRNTELATHEFGTQVYMLLFEEFAGDFYRREVCSHPSILDAFFMHDDNIHVKSGRILSDS